MRLIIMGCEYVGKSTLTGGVRTWLVDNMGSCETSFHDHFVRPFTEGQDAEQEEHAQHVLAMPPSLLEMYSRYMIHYHISAGFYAANDHCMVNSYYGDAVYAPLYYGFGGRGEYADRKTMARYYDQHVMELAPDSVLVHMKASPDVIRQRMAENAHPHCPLKAEDVEGVLERFAEEASDSLLRRKIVLDTSVASPQETLTQLMGKIEPFLSQQDRVRYTAHRLMHS
jgi:hypothetical protein